MVFDTQAETDFIFGKTPVDTGSDSAIDCQLIQQQEVPAMGGGSMQWRELRPGVNNAYRDNTDAESDDGNLPSKAAGSHLENEDEDFFVPKAISRTTAQAHKLDEIIQGGMMQDEMMSIPPIEDHPKLQKSKYFNLSEGEGEKDEEIRDSASAANAIASHTMMMSGSVPPPVPKEDDSTMTDDGIEEDEGKDRSPGRKILPPPRWMRDDVDETAPQDDDMDENADNFDMSSLIESLSPSPYNAPIAASSAPALPSSPISPFGIAAQSMKNPHSPAPAHPYSNTSLVSAHTSAVVPTAIPAEPIQEMASVSPTRHAALVSPAPTISTSAPRRILERIKRRLPQAPPRPVPAAPPIQFDLTPSADAPKLDKRFVISNSPTRPACNIKSLNPDYRPERNLDTTPRLKTRDDERALEELEKAMNKAANKASEDFQTSTQARIEEQKARDEARDRAVNKTRAEKRLEAQKAAYLRKGRGGGPSPNIFIPSKTSAKR
ncbi:hypothetical protein O1611_g9795 [Lasiodiplodia mahajangana]|uniref:Uncharacterized protein n=1 Tax=Lasiodiplodia mahajangana TaxID=1108764 RepID=A0ACC2J564_9PEZI|nr:hypothetical protein O1611_g9795 [Lasiodiplodia mahajangana]